MEEKFGIVWKWQGDTIKFDAPSGKAKGTKGEVAVTDKHVRVAIDLPFLLKVLKGSPARKASKGPKASKGRPAPRAPQRSYPAPGHPPPPLALTGQCIWTR